MSKYVIYTAGPIDHFDDYVHVSDITQELENFIIVNPRSTKTFHELWNIVLDKIYWAWTKAGNIDLDLRQPDFWIRIVREENDVKEIFVIFKADNNGQMYAIVDNCFDCDDNIKENLLHEFGDEWEKLE